MDAELISEGLSLVKGNGREWVERNRGTGAVEIVATLLGGSTRIARPIPMRLDDVKILLIEQYRPAVDKVVLELPAGVIGDHDKDEPAELAAARELEEETGYRAGALHFMAMGPSCAGLCSELTSFFLATDLKKVSDGGGVEDEKITVHEVPLINIGPWIAEKKLMADPRIWAGLYLRIAFLTARPDVGRL